MARPGFDFSFIFYYSWPISKFTNVCFFWCIRFSFLVETYFTGRNNVNDNDNNHYFMAIIQVNLC